MPTDMTTAIRAILNEHGRLAVDVAALSDKAIFTRRASPRTRASP